MAYRPIVVSVIITIIIIISLFKIYTLFYRPLVHHLNPDMQLLGIINTDGSHEISQHAILNGEDSLLVVDHASLLYQGILQKIPQAKYFTSEEVFNVNNLHLFDKDSGGILTSKDPIFEHLFIVRFYSNGQQNDIKSLAAAGIHGIYTSRTPAGDYEVLMADGSERTLYSINKMEKK